MSLENMHWAFSKLEQYDTCPMAFYLQYVRSPPATEMQNAYAQYGTFAHSLLERWAKGELPEFFMSDEWKDGYDAAITMPFPPFPRNLGETSYDKGLSYFENFTGFGDQYEPIAAEEKFLIYIGGYPVSGIVDLVLRDKNTGDLVIIDHKSKSAASMKKDREKYTKQLYIYAKWCKEKYGKYPVKVAFNLFKEGGTLVEENFTETRMAETEEWVKKTIEAILATKEWRVSPSGYFCRYICGVCSECPAYDAVLAGDYEKKRKKDQGNE